MALASIHLISLSSPLPQKIIIIKNLISGRYRSLCLNCQKQYLGHSYSHRFFTINLLVTIYFYENISYYVCDYSDVSVTDHFSPDRLLFTDKQSTSAEQGNSGHIADISGQFLKCKKNNVQFTKRDMLQFFVCFLYIIRMECIKFQFWRETRIMEREERERERE